MFAAKVVRDTADDLRGGEQAGRFDHGPLAMHPVRFNRIQPRTLDRQPPGHKADAPVALNRQIVGSDPRAHRLAGVPGGIVPQQHQDAFLLGRQPLAEPGEKGGRDMTDRPSIDKPQLHFVLVGPQQPIAAQRFGFMIPLGRQLFDPPQGFPRGPAVQRGVRQAAPPGLIGKAQHPIRMLGGQGHQPVALLFLTHSGDRGW